MSQYDADAAGGEPSPASNSMTPTEALARALADWRSRPAEPMPWDTEDAEKIVAALVALGYEVRPIESPTLLHEVDYDDLRREQAAEAADREADYQRFLYPKGKPAAVAPLEPIPTDWGVGPLTRKRGGA